MSSPATDSRGVRRGRCTSCECPGYQGGTAGLKCICTHPPGKHQNITPGFAAQTYGSSRPSNTSDAHGGYSYQNVYRPPATGPCSAPDCSNSCYYDPSVGEFDYCSPPCRDKHLLPKEKKRLHDDLQAFECPVQYESGKQPRNGPPATGGESEYRSAQVLGGSGSPTYSAVLLSGTQATSSSSGSPGRQTTLKVHFQKNPSKDIGLIVSEEKYRRKTFSGLLVLGFEYNTKAEHLITCGEVHVLDVITSLNDKEVSPFTYADEMKKGTGTLILNRSIALPEIKLLLEKASAFKPSYVVVVMNPIDITGCSTLKGFGFEVLPFEGTIVVGSVPENTPARFSRIKFQDEIIAYAFVKNNKLTLGRGHLTNSKLENNASDGQTLILVAKRKII